MTELAWIAEARAYIDMHERDARGLKTIPLWVRALKGWWSDTKSPWCGTFVGHCLQAAGRDIAKEWYRAKAWVNGATRLAKPAYGCIVVFERQGGGHVGFVVGQDKQGILMVLGGNQGDAVNIKPFAKSRAVAYLWPNKGGKPAYPAEERYTLPLLQSDGKLSRNEA